MSIKTENKIIELYKNHKSIREISKTLNVSPKPIKKVLLKNNIAIVKHNKPLKKDKIKEYIKNETTKLSIVDLPNETIEKIIKDYLKNKTTIDLAKEYGIKYQSIVSYLHKNKIKKDTKIIKLDNKSIINKYINGQSISSLSNEHNVSEWSIREVLLNKNIKTRSPYDLRKNDFDYSFFEKETPELYYFMGFMLGDGSITSNDVESRYNIRVGLHNKDISTIHLFCDWLSFNKDNIYTPPNKSVKHLTINSSKFKNGFAKFGVVPNKTYEPIIPDILDSKYLSYFLIGLLDADGHVNFGKINVISLTCNTEIIHWYIKAIKHLGFNGKVSFKDTQSEVASRVNITRRDDVLQLAKLLKINKCDFCMYRKWKHIKCYFKALKLI